MGCAGALRQCAALHGARLSQSEVHNYSMFVLFECLRHLLVSITHFFLHFGVGVANSNREFNNAAFYTAKKVITIRTFHSICDELK